MANRHGLGRGLGALLSAHPTGPRTATAAADRAADRSRSVANPNQPRKDFDDKALRELSRVASASGVIQPIVVRRKGEGYQLIAGERRWRAAKPRGLDQVPAIVREATDAQSLELALVENLLREDLNPMEEAEAYQRLLAEFGWTQEELAQRVGKDRSSIANCLRLLGFPESRPTCAAAG